MKQQFSVAQLFDGDRWHQQVTVDVVDGVIDAITPAKGAVLPWTMVPGFIDVQVNGGGGALFNTEPSLQALRTMVKAHAQFGSVGLVPTVITDCIEVMQRTADAVAEAIRAGEPGVLGIHFEGPHLSVPKKGVHPVQHIRGLSADELALYGRTDLGVKVVTVAPENVTPEQIAQLVALNVHVCLGHTNADGATTAAALAAGASGFTHLYNAMSPLTSREPGVVGVALADRNSWCGIILDGHHVHPTAAKLAIHAKPRGKMMIVTDAMSPVGTNDTEFPFFDGKVTRDGNKLTNDHGQLAGSVLDMADAVRYAVQQLGVAHDEALQMAARYPAEFLALGQSHGQLKVGYRADFALVDKFAVKATYVAGQPLYQA
ncbi:MAG TPA: N-acetylglucosamine-6-phosphate deacetylase [Rheinheimera sp.]|nr:N-acetylglucosamine-6-phosphate deacetylase [Rheinheimera sp.]